jgi:AraC-like DNA-binding protein
VLALCGRERARALLKRAFPRRRTRLVLTRTQAEFRQVFGRELVDAAIVDLGAPNDDTAAAIDAARDYPSAPFFGLTALRSADASIVARCVTHEFADLLVESVDDAVLRDLVVPQSFTRRFADALAEPPEALHLSSDLQRRVWTAVVAHGGRPLHSDDLAKALAVTREHLSRAFAARSAPNLKRVIDLVRLLAAAELAKNPGFDVGDVAAVLRFASSSHLSTTARRVVGTRPTSLTRLRTVDLVDRFVVGRSRSRARSAAEKSELESRRGL